MTTRSYSSNFEKILVKNNFVFIFFVKQPSIFLRTKNFITPSSTITFVYNNLTKIQNASKNGMVEACPHSIVGGNICKFLILVFLINNGLNRYCNSTSIIHDMNKIFLLHKLLIEVTRITVT